MMLDTPYDNHIKFYSEEDPPIIIVLLKPMLEIHYRCQLPNKLFIDKFIAVFNSALVDNEKFQLEIDISKSFCSRYPKKYKLNSGTFTYLRKKFSK